MSWSALLAVLMKAWPVIEAAAKAVETVQAQTGVPEHQAVAAVIDHLTPGQPNSPVLTPPA